MPLMVSSVARHSPRISEPRLNSTSSLSARTLPRSLAPPTVTERNCSEGAGNSRASSLPATRTGAPTIRVASASNCGRNWFQSMKYGPTSAAINAMMKAIANPSSVVCTVSPLGCRRARPHPRRAGAGTPGNIETSVAKSQRHHTDAAGPFGRRYTGGASPYQLAGSRSRPRSTKLGRHSAFTASSSRRSGIRRSRVEIATSASMRASWAPRQKWMPPPKDSGLTFGRVISSRSGWSG